MFTGRRVDILDNGSLTIQYNRNRYYDQYTGRWLTHDPLGITPNPRWPNRFAPSGQYRDGMSLYEYVKSHPSIYFDPWGLMLYPGYRYLKRPEPYDWWDPVDPSGHIKCERPCRWYPPRRFDKVTWSVRVSGCTSVSPSLPIGPGAGTALVIIGVIWEVAQPSMTVCNTGISVGFACECVVKLRRRCEKKCCVPPPFGGIFTRRKTAFRAIYRYGKGVYKSWGLDCSCNPTTKWISYGSWATTALQEDLKKTVKCE